MRHNQGTSDEDTVRRQVMRHNQVTSYGNTARDDTDNDDVDTLNTRGSAEARAGSKLPVV